MRWLFLVLSEAWIFQGLRTIYEMVSSFPFLKCFYELRGDTRRRREATNGAIQ